MSDTRRLAIELHEIRQLALSHATNPQFGNSSVDGEGLSFRDGDGNEIGRIGGSENGMEVEYTYGPKPLMPSTPIVTADANLLLVQWDGQWAGGNEDGDAVADPDLASQAGLDRVEVHVSMEPTFVPDPILSFAGVLPVTPEGGAHTVGPLAEAGDYYVVLMARGKDGQYSAPSQRVHVVTTVGLMENELFDLALRADEARESADGKNTVHYGEEPEAPEGGFSEGDLWFDTTEDPETGFRKNTPHLWDPSANNGEGGWVSAADSRVDAVRDAQDALREDVERIVTDGAGATTYWLPTEPGESTDPPPREGDLWFNTAEGAETYLHRYTNGAWVGVDDARVGALEDAQEEFAQELTDTERRALESARGLADAAREAAEERARAAQESADEAIARAIALRDAGSNLLLNGDFENASPDIWPNNSYQDSVAVIEVPDARSGTHVLEQGNSASSRYPLTDWLDTTEGRIYYVELWARRTDEASTARIAFYRQVELTDKSTPGAYAQHLDDGAAYYYGSDIPVGEWVKLSGYFTMPKDALRFRFGPHTTAVNPPYHFDDMRVIDVTEAVGALRAAHAVEVAAAADAAAKMEQAEANAAIEAARLANEAAVREAGEAESAAKAYADLIDTGASEADIAAAREYAEQQAEEARIAAEAAAALDATAKAETAEANAAVEAARVAREEADQALADAKADATVKADAALDAAIEAAEEKDQQVRTDIDAVIDGAVSDLEGDIATVRTSVDGKSRITQSVDAPPAQYDGAVGDRWERMSSMGSGGSLISNWRWNGNVWVSTLISDAVLGNVDAAKIGTGYLDANRIRAGSIYADKIVSGLSQNMVPDPGFVNEELNAARVSRALGYGGAFSVADGVVHLDATAPLAGAPNISLAASADVLAWPAYPNMKVIAKAEMRATEGSMLARWTIRFQRRDGSTPFQAMTPGSYTTLGSEWAELVGEYTLPPDAVGYSVSVQFNAASAGKAEFRAPFAASSVGTTVIEDGAVTTDKILANAITAGKIDTGAVEAEHIAAGAVEAEHIVAGGIEADSLIVAGSLGETSIADGAISTRTVQADAIGAAAIAAGVIEGDHVKAGSLTADKLLVGGAYNLLPNGDLSAGNTAMWPSDAVYATADPPPGHDRYVDWGVSTSTASLSTFGNFPVTVGDEIVVELWIKADKPGSVAYIGANDQGGAAVALGQAANWIAETFTNDAGSYPVGRVSVPDAWTLWRSRLKITNPDTTEVYLGSVFRNHSFGAIRDARLFTSGIRLFKRVGATLIAGGAVTTRHIETGSITAESGIIASLDAGKITVGELDGARIKAKSVQADSVIVDGSVGTTLIDGGAVTTEKIAVGAITAESGIIGSLDAGVITTGELRGELIRAQSIAGESLAVDAIDGKTITGALVRTSSAGARVEMDSTGLFVKNSLGANTVSMTNGTLTMQGGTITGGTIRTHTTGARVQLDTGGLKAWNPSNEETFSISANTGTVSMTGNLNQENEYGRMRVGPNLYSASDTSPAISFARQGSSPWGSAGMMLGGNFPDDSLRLQGTLLNEGQGSWARLSGHGGADATGIWRSFSLGRVSGLSLYSNGEAELQSRGSTARMRAFTLTGVAPHAWVWADTDHTAGFRNSRDSSVYIGSDNSVHANAHGGSVYLSSRTSGGTSRGFISVTDTGVYLNSEGKDMYFTSNRHYFPVVSQGSGAPLGRDSGRLVSMSSARKYKIAEEPLESTVASFEDKLLAVEPKTWINREAAEQLADYHLSTMNGEEHAQSLDAIGTLDRDPGVVAEDLEASGLSIFVGYENGEPEWVKYDRIGPALIPVVRRLRDRVNELERMMGEMANA